jgi:hypothetical protein
MKSERGEASEGEMQFSPSSPWMAMKAGAEPMKMFFTMAVP